MNLIDFNSDFFQNLPDGTELISRLDSISNSENKPISTIPFGCEIDINELFERAKSSVRFIKKEEVKNDLSLYKLTHVNKKDKNIESSGYFILYRHPDYDNVYIAFTFEESVFFNQELKPFIKSFYPEIIFTFIKSKNMLDLIEQFKLRNEISAIIINKANFILRKEDEESFPGLSWPKMPLDEAFNWVVNDQNGWFKSLKFDAIRYNKIITSVFINRQGIVKTDLNFEMVYNAFIQPICKSIDSNYKQFRNRDRRSSENLDAKPLVVEYDSEIFKNVDENIIFINAISRLDNASVSTLHGNPYIHLSIIDYLDGSSFDLWVLNSKEIILVPQMRGTIASIKRILNHIFDTFAEGEIKDYEMSY
ncbi:MAG: hypothetical protein A2X08_13780 [Bacteroidetes bacterium GWA2_32_17]|nr:MAG: hypothetical protein A2X08_13780 [Bacteroidetes bacterium GWA2_32_17]